MHTLYTYMVRLLLLGITLCVPTLNHVVHVFVILLITSTFVLYKVHPAVTFSVSLSFLKYTSNHEVIQHIDFLRQFRGQKVENIIKTWAETTLKNNYRLSCFNNVAMQMLKKIIVKKQTLLVVLCVKYSIL